MEAEQYFTDRIHENLKNTGDSYYERIVETINQVKQINLPLAKKQVAEIRNNYRRRRNLMALLDRFS